MSRNNSNLIEKTMTKRYWRGFFSCFGGDAIIALERAAALDPTFAENFVQFGF